MRMPPLAAEAFVSVQVIGGPLRPRVVYKACAHCGRPVTLRYRPSPTFRPMDNSWPCPHHDCHPGAVSRITLPGNLLGCWPGHVPTPPTG